MSNYVYLRAECPYCGRVDLYDAQRFVSGGTSWRISTLGYSPSAYLYQENDFICRCGKRFTTNNYRVIEAKD